MPERWSADTRGVTWILAGLCAVGVLIGVALLWRAANEMERGEGPQELTRQRTLGTWIVLVLGYALRWLIFWR